MSETDKELKKLKEIGELYAKEQEEIKKHYEKRITELYKIIATQSERINELENELEMDFK